MFEQVPALVVNHPQERVPKLVRDAAASPMVDSDAYSVVHALKVTSRDVPHVDLDDFDSPAKLVEGRERWRTAKEPSVHARLKLAQVVGPLVVRQRYGSPHDDDRER